MIDAFLGVARAGRYGAFMWKAIRPLTPALFNRASHRTVVLMSPHLPWYDELRDGNVVARWAAGASAIPYAEEICQSVVNTLLHIASIDSLRIQLPPGIWTWLNKRPPLPPACFGRSMGTKGNAVCEIRGLGDVEILKSYFLLVWSEWGHISDRSGLTEMQTSIREDFGGVGLGEDRKDLIERLDHILGQLGRGSEYLGQRVPWIDTDDIQLAKRQYRELKEMLLEVDMEGLEILTRTPSR